MPQATRPFFEPATVVHKQSHVSSSWLLKGSAEKPYYAAPVESPGGRRERTARRRDVLSFEQIVAARQLRQGVRSAPFIPPAPAIPPGHQSGARNGIRPSPQAPTLNACPHPYDVASEDSYADTDLYVSPLASVPQAGNRLITADPPSAEPSPATLQVFTRERSTIRRPAEFNPEKPTPSQRAAMQKPRTKLDKHGRAIKVLY